MIRSLFSRPSQDAIRLVKLYFSRDSVIVAATHQIPNGGAYYEQPSPVVLQGQPAAAQLGATFHRAFAGFSVKDKDLSALKRTDWPAFRASGARSLKEFQALFLPMQCCGLNSANILVRASTPHPVHEDLELSVSFNPLIEPEAVGEKLLQLADVAKRG